MTLETKLDILESKIDKLYIEQKTILNIEEVAKYSGFSKDYIYRLISSKMLIPSKPTSRRVFFEKKEIDNWLLSRAKTKYNN